MPGPFLSVILPAFNEEGNILSAVQAAEAVLGKTGSDYEIIVVDDGSVDGTGRLAGEIARWCPTVRVASHPRNVGYGAALKTGLGLAKGDLIFFTDADLQFDIAEITRLLEWIGHYDMVIGYRERRQDHWGRRVLAWGWGTLIALLFGLRVRDIDCAFKLFRRRVIDQVAIGSLGAFVNSEILLRATRRGFTFKEIPVSHFPRRRGRATGARPRIIYRALRELLKLSRELRQGG